MDKPIVVLPLRDVRAQRPQRRVAQEHLRVSEVAAKLNVSKSKVYQLIREGSLPSWRDGRTVTVPVDGFDRWYRARLRDDMERV